MKKPTILLVHNYYQLSGGEDTVFKNEKELLEKNGYNVLTYTRDNKEIKKYKIFKKIGLFFTSIYSRKTVKDVKKIIKNNEIDIIHVHNTLSLISPSIYYIGVKHKIPVIQTLHNFRLLCPNGTFYRENSICEDCTKKGLKCAIKHKCYRDSRIQTFISTLILKIHRFTGIYKKIYYITLTQFNYEKFVSSNIIPQNRLFIKPNFSNVDNFEVLTKRKKQILFVGRLEHIKGIELLIETWNKYGAKLPNLKIYGTGPLKDYCENKITNEKICNIFLMGQEEHSKVIQELSESEALILPTQVYEGFPMTIVEAFSTGTPVLCSNFGNSSAVVIEGVTGYKFSNNCDSIFEAINKLGKEKLDYSAIFKHFSENYTKEKTLKILNEIYEKIRR